MPPIFLYSLPVISRPHPALIQINADPIASHVGNYIRHGDSPCALSTTLTSKVNGFSPS